MTNSPFEWGLEQPGVVEDVPARGKWLEIDDFEGSFQPKSFYDSEQTAHSKLSVA